MSDPRPGDPDAVLSSELGPDERVRMRARNLALAAEGRAGWAPSAEHPAALEYLLAALAADLLAGLAREVRAAGPALHAAELRLKAWLENPLVVAGVRGEEGSARLREIEGSLYVDTDASAPEIETLWRRVRERAPVLASLAPGVAITLRLQRVT